MLRKKLKLVFFTVAAFVAVAGLSSFSDGGEGDGGLRYDPFLCRAFCNGTNYEWPSCKTPNATGACDRVVWCEENWPC